MLLSLVCMGKALVLAAKIVGVIMVFTLSFSMQYEASEKYKEEHFHKERRGL